MMNGKGIVRLILSALVIFICKPAFANSGTVSGNLAIYENEGNYCPVGTVDCTGARYLSTTYQTSVPVRNTVVYALNSLNTVIGSGVTDNSGHFIFGWSDGMLVENAHVEWHGEQRDGHFAVRTAGNGTLVFGSNNTNWGSGSWNLGTITWGNAGSPNELANVFNGATREWDRLGTSNRMNGAFTGTNIDGLLSSTNDPLGNPCRTSCTEREYNRIYLSPDAPFQPQDRVMHEMGHIAMYKSHLWHATYDYCWGGEPTPCSWVPNAPEYDDVGFEEGMATFIGDTGLYDANAATPRQCLSATYCGTGPNDTNIEESHGNILCGGSSCATNEDRMPMSTERLFWDAYDSHADNYLTFHPSFCSVSTSDNSTHNIWEFFDTMYAWPSGTGVGQSEEMWCNTSYTTICNHDGRSALDYLTLWNTWGGDALTVQRNGNCAVGH